MKVLLFCGGYGMWMRSGESDLPKPMTTIGPRSLIWHVIRYDAHFGHTFVHTGLDSPIGRRLRRVRKHVENEEIFLANHADVLTDAPLDQMVDTFGASAQGRTMGYVHDGFGTRPTPSRSGRRWRPYQSGARPWMLREDKPAGCHAAGS